MKIKVQYYALFREKAGKSLEEMDFFGETAEELLLMVKEKYNIHLASDHVRVAINSEFCERSKKLSEGDHVVFVPPVAGG